MTSTKRTFVVTTVFGVVALFLIKTTIDFSLARMRNSNVRRAGNELALPTSSSDDNLLTVYSEDLLDAPQTPILQHRTKIPKVLSQGLPPGSGSYHKVTGADIWVYSVFYEPVRPGTLQPEIRAVGFGYLNVKFGKIICEVTDENSISQDFEATFRWAVDDHYDRQTVNGSACFLECLVPLHYQPRYVRLYTQSSEINTATDKYNFPVLYRATRQRKMTVCYSVFHGGFDKGGVLVNAVEYNRQMGAEHFFIYIQGVGSKFHNVIDFYTSKGLMTALELPAFPSEHAWYHGQIVAINDCLQRNKGISEFVLFADTDEYIIPLKYTNWLDLIEDVENKETLQNPTKRIGSFSFLNSYYCKKRIKEERWEYLRAKIDIATEEERVIKHNKVLIFYRHFHENVKSYPSRSKTFHRPELIYEPGIHFAHKLLPNVSYIVINETVGYSAHFQEYGNRAYRPSIQDCQDDFRVYDFHRPYLTRLMDTQSEIEAYLINKTTVS